MTKVAASLTIHDIPEMTKKGRYEIANWLISLAIDIQREPEIFAKKFTAKYHYVPKKIKVNQK